MGIAAFGGSRQPEHALALLHKMRDTSRTANVISFNKAISACAKKGGHWEQALTLLHKMTSDPAS